MNLLRLQADKKDGDGNGQTRSVITRTKPKVKKPSLYQGAAAQ
jgi:hypothetical protein